MVMRLAALLPLASLLLPLASSFQLEAAKYEYKPAEYRYQPLQDRDEAHLVPRQRLQAPGRGPDDRPGRGPNDGPGRAPDNGPGRGPGPDSDREPLDGPNSGPGRGPGGPDGNPNEAASFRQLLANYNQQAMNSLQQSGQCTQQNIIVRREWSDMTTEARQAFIQACYCLRSRPSQDQNPIAPGTRNRWDDFVGGHATHNDPIHVSPFLLAWHRHFDHEMERALREECGYPFGIPYLDFTRYGDTPPEQWPVFDNSPTSLSGNGELTQDGCSCVRRGPLADWQVNLGNAGDNGQCRPNPSENGLGFNPHCLERRFDLSQLADLSEDVVLDHILNTQDANEFMVRLESAPNFVHGSILPVRALMAPRPPFMPPVLPPSFTL